MGVGVGVRVIVGVWVGVGVRAIVGVWVGVGVRVIVGVGVTVTPNNCPGLQPESNMLTAKTDIATNFLLIFIFLQCASGAPVVILMWGMPLLRMGLLFFNSEKGVYYNF